MTSRAACCEGGGRRVAAHLVQGRAGEQVGLRVLGVGGGSLDKQGQGLGVPAPVQFRREVSQKGRNRFRARFLEPLVGIPQPGVNRVRGARFRASAARPIPRLQNFSRVPAR